MSVVPHFAKPARKKKGRHRRLATLNVAGVELFPDDVTFEVVGDENQHGFLKFFRNCGF